jgi:hypothetical protein
LSLVVRETSVFRQLLDLGLDPAHVRGTFRFLPKQSASAGDQTVVVGLAQTPADF